MNCVVCKGNNISVKVVDEELRHGSDVVLLPLKISVCGNCGERYYDKYAMKLIENARDSLREDMLSFDEVGRVYRAKAA